MTDIIHVAEYWPLFKTNEIRRFIYSNPDASSFTSVFSYDRGSDSMLYNNYDSTGKWLNRWYYTYKLGFGISEWRDDYPNGKKVVLDPPIGWGEFQAIGSTYENQPRFSFFKSWPMAFSKGEQIVAYEELLAKLVVNGTTYFNILVMSYLQAWDGKPATGARYYMAKNIGPIAVSFLTQDGVDRTKVTESVRWEATVSSMMLAA
jgi:hypothetical protein